MAKLESSSQQERGSSVSGGLEKVRETESDHEVYVAETIHAISPTEWNQVVEGSECATVFHRYEWLDAIETAFDTVPKHLLVTKDDNAIGVFPNFVMDLDFDLDLPTNRFRRLRSIQPGFGGPLITTDETTVFDLMFDAILDICNRNTVVHEIESCNTNHLRYNEALQSRGYRPSWVGGRFVVQLNKGYEQIRNEMESSKRRAIRRGRETDHEVIEENVTKANLKRVQTAHETIMDRVGEDPYPDGFFEALTGMKDNILLLSLQIDGEHAGCFLELLDEERSAVHGFTSTVSAEYFSDHASEILYDHTFQWAIENGYDTYDFGGSKSDFDDGVFGYKEEFGGQLIPNLYWERGCSSIWRAITMGRSIYRRYGGR